MIDQNPGRYEGLSMKDRKAKGTLHEVKTVEIMAPIMSSRVWIQCIRPRLVRDRGNGWGVDLTIFNYGKCVPAHLFSVRLPLDHVNHKTASSKKSFYKEGSREIQLY